MLNRIYVYSLDITLCESCSKPAQQRVTIESRNHFYCVDCTNKVADRFMDEGYEVHYPITRNAEFQASLNGRPVLPAKSVIEPAPVKQEENGPSLSEARRSILNALGEELPEVQAYTLSDCIRELNIALKERNIKPPSRTVAVKACIASVMYIIINKNGVIRLYKEDRYIPTSIKTLKLLINACRNVKSDAGNWFRNV